MSLWIIIPVLLVMAFLGWTLLQRRYQGAVITGNKKDKALASTAKVRVAAVEASEQPDREWWKGISPIHQQQLALHLVERALPVWERYTGLQPVTYRAASAGPLIVVKEDLLQIALKEIRLHLDESLPLHDGLKLGPYQKAFIGPVLALKDGLWVCSYPVKKIFLSVYFLLMSITVTPGVHSDGSHISAAIQAVLECLELSKLYTREEIQEMLEDFRGGM